MVKPSAVNASATQAEENITTKSPNAIAL